MFNKIVDYALTFVVSTWGQAVGEAIYDTVKVYYRSRYIIKDVVSETVKHE